MNLLKQKTTYPALAAAGLAGMAVAQGYIDPYLGSILGLLAMALVFQRQTLAKLEKHFHLIVPLGMFLLLGCTPAREFAQEHADQIGKIIGAGVDVAIQSGFAALSDKLPGETDAPGTAVPIAGWAAGTVGALVAQGLKKL